MIKKARKWHIPTITQEEFDEQLFLKKLISGQLRLAIIYANDFDSYEILTKICSDPKNIINSPCSKQEYYSFLWNSKILLNIFYNVPVQMDQDFYFFEIEEMIKEREIHSDQNPREKAKLTKLIEKRSDLQFVKKVLKTTDTQISIDDGRETIEYLISLRKEDYNIIFALQPSISNYMKRISIKKKSFKFTENQINTLDVLSVYRDISEDELSSYIEDLSIFSNEVAFKNLMTQLFLFYNENFYLKLQTLFSTFDLGSYLQSQINNLLLAPIYKFPEYIGFYVLADQSLSSKEHFVDIFWKKKMKYHITHFLDEAKPFSSHRKLEELIPFFCVACFEQLYPHKNTFHAVIQYIFPKSNDKYSQSSEFIRNKIYKINDLIQSVENDNELVYSISQDLGKKVTLDTLVTESIPYIFKEKSPPYDDNFFSMIFNTKSFLVSESDMKIDELFLYAPKIYIAIINFVIGKEKEIPKDLNKLNKHFKVSEIQRKIFIDIYSLIFFQDQDNQYYCTITKADSILQFLITFNVNETMTKETQDLIKNSRQHISFSQLKKQDDLKSAIFSYENYLANLIISGKEDEFQTAKTLVPALGSPKLKTILQILVFMRDPEDESKIEDQNKYCFAVELHFSKEISKKPKIINDINNNNDDINIEEEEEKEEEELNEKEKIFMDWLTDQQLIDLQKYFSDDTLSNINDLNDIHSLYQNPLDILFKKGNLLHTSTWRAYMKLYAKFEKAVKNDKNNQHYDPNKRLEPSEIVQILHKSEINASMNNLDTLLGPHALEFLLLYTPEFNEKTYNLVESKSPITAQAIRYEFALKGNYKNSNKDNVYERLLAKKAGYGDDEFEIFSIDFEALADSHDSALTSFAISELDELIDKYANTNPLQVNILNEIFLREPTIYIQKMKDIVRNNFKRFTINKLLDLYPFCGLKSLPLLKRMKVDIIDEKEIIYLLVGKTRWETLRLFLEDLEYLFEVNKEENQKSEVEERVLQLITNYIRDHPGIIQTIPKDFLSKIDVDQFINNTPQQDYETCYVIESISDLNYYLRRSNEDFDVNETIDMINRLLQPLVIDNNFRELIQRQIHKLSFLFSKRFKHSFATKLRALSSMLYRDLLGRYGIIISLSNFSKETFGLHVAKIYLKYDFFKECQEICAAWSLDLSLYKAEMALSAFKIGLVNEGMDFISPPIRNDQLVDQIVDILSNKFIFDYSPIVDVTEFKNVDKYAESVDPCHHWINVQFTDNNGIPQIDSPLVAESPQIKALHKLLIDLNSIDKLIMFYASKGYFEYAFDTWNTIKRRHTKSELFIRSIVFPSLVFQNWTSLWMKVRKMYDIEPNTTNTTNTPSTQMKPYVLDLFKFLHQRKMGNTAYNIQMSLHLYSLAFKTAYDYFSEMKSWEGQLRIIEAMKKASKKDKEVSKEILAKVDFEENYLIKPCIENNTPFIPGMNIMTTKENALKASVFLMKKGEADTVMLKLLPMTIFNMNEMCHAMLDDVMLSSETGAMHKLFLAIEKANLQNYEVIVMSLFQAINTRVADQRSLSQFIDENVRDYLKGRIFITFEILDRAYDCAVKTNDNYLMELVRENAEKKGNKELYLKANEFLEK